MSGAGRAWRVAFGRWRRRAVERFASAAVLSLAWNKRIRRAMLHKLFDGYLPHDRICLAQFTDHAFFVSPRDQTIGFELLSGKPWQRDELERAIAILEKDMAFKPGGAFVDIGANIGTQTVYAMLTGKFTRAWAVEAAQENFELLQRNVTLNGLDARVQTIHAAAGAATGEVVLRLNAKNAGGHSVSERHLRYPEGAERVRCETVDVLAAEAGIDWGRVSVVWIDVEGAEAGAIAGMPAALCASVPIVFEYTPEPNAAGGWQEIRCRLVAYGYDQCAWLDCGKDAKPVSLARLAEPGKQCDLVVWKKPAVAPTPFASARGAA
jgi:FkbM family methyltransferase